MTRGLVVLMAAAMWAGAARAEEGRGFVWHIEGPPATQPVVSRLERLERDARAMLEQDQRALADAKAAATLQGVGRIKPAGAPVGAGKPLVLPAVCRNVYAADVPKLAKMLQDPELRSGGLGAALVKTLLAEAGRVLDELGEYVLAEAAQKDAAERADYDRRAAESSERRAREVAQAEEARAERERQRIAAAEEAAERAVAEAAAAQAAMQAAQEAWEQRQGGHDRCVRPPAQVPVQPVSPEPPAVKKGPFRGY